MYEAYLRGHGWIQLTATSLADAQPAGLSLGASQVRRVVEDIETDNEEGRQEALSAGCDYGDD